MKKKNNSPEQDAGWGLIYRLNNLWGQVDPKATGGDYDGWNFVLDRLYCNLLYEKEMIIKRVYKCQKGHIFYSLKELKECPKCRKDSAIKSEIEVNKIESVDLCEEDKLIYDFLSEKIREIVNNKLKAVKDENKKHNGKTIEQYKTDHYKALMMKDIWLRKFMQDQGLYLRVSKIDASKAMFGG